MVTILHRREHGKKQSEKHSLPIGRFAISEINRWAKIAICGQREGMPTGFLGLFYDFSRLK